MPNRPKRPCAQQGCPNLTHNRFCEAHAKQDARNYERFKRDPTTKDRYGADWRHIRELYLSTHKLCEMCMREGHYTAATLVHHKTMLTQGGTHDAENLMALCASCHGKVHADRWRGYN